jgi:ABC-type Na+ efflux pump permease subunit
MDTIIERLFLIGIGLMIICPLIPIAISLIISFIIGCGKNANKETNNDLNSNKVNVSKPNSKSTTEPNNKNIKVVTTEGYTEFNNILKASVQNKLLDRETILKLKSELRYKIGTHIEVYKNFEFQNDLHELYVLSKSSVLTKEDYIYLTQFISDNLNFQKEA